MILFLSTASLIILGDARLSDAFTCVLLVVCSLVSDGFNFYLKTRPDNVIIYKQALDNLNMNINIAASININVYTSNTTIYTKEIVHTVPTTYPNDVYTAHRLFPS